MIFGKIWCIINNDMSLYGALNKAEIKAAEDVKAKDINIVYAELSCPKISCCKAQIINC